MKLETFNVIGNVTHNSNACWQMETCFFQLLQGHPQHYIGYVRLKIPCHIWGEISSPKPCWRERVIKNNSFFYVYWNELITGGINNAYSSMPLRWCIIKTISLYIPYVQSPEINNNRDTEDGLLRWISNRNGMGPREWQTKRGNRIQYRI